MPFAGFARQLLAPRDAQRIVLRPTIVLGLAPLRFDEPLLFKFEERGVQRGVVEREAVVARLLDAASDAVPVQRSEDLEGLENHQGERALLYVRLLRHVTVLWDSHRTVVMRTASRNGNVARGCFTVASSARHSLPHVDRKSAV